MFDEKKNSITIGELIREEQKKQILLPNYQRPFRWSTDDQRRLLISLILELPIGSLLLSIGNSGEYYSRALCYDFEINADTDNTKVNFLLDGQQRISTIKSIFCDLFHEDTYKVFLKKEDLKNYQSDSKKLILIKGEERVLPKKLCNRWFLKLGINKNDSSNNENSSKNIQSNIERLSSRNINKDPDLSLESYEPLVHFEEVRNKNATSKKPFSSITIKDLGDECDSNHMLPLWLVYSDMEKESDEGAYEFKSNATLEKIVDRLIGKAVENLEDDEKNTKEKDLKKIIRNFFDKILRQIEIPMHVMNESDEHKMITIFHQVNTGGIRLSAPMT